MKPGDLKLSPLSGGVTASDLSVADQSSIRQGPFPRTKSMHIGVELRPLLPLRQLNVPALTVKQPDIALM